MLTFEKHPYSLTLIVKENNIEIDQIHYSSIEELCSILNDYYFIELTSYKKI